jgi:hypothetical protein
VSPRKATAAPRLRCVGAFFVVGLKQIAAYAEKPLARRLRTVHAPRMNRTEGTLDPCQGSGNGWAS